MIHLRRREVSIYVFALVSVAIWTSGMSITYYFTHYEGNGVLLSASTLSIRQTTARVENLGLGVRS